VIFAEDTRVSNKLLHHYDIRKPLRSFHERVETARIAELRALLAEGKAVAVVTDAGMPGISDPGSELVRAARESNAAIEVLPGPSVALAALVLSGFDVARFRFDGFPPRKSAERRRYLGGLQHEESPVVWFESARRVGELLRDVAAMLPQRRLFVLREYTKLFEQHLAGSAAELLRELKEQRGEFTIVLEGCERGQAPQVDVARIDDAVALLRDAGLGARTISEVLRLATGLPKNELYRLAARKLRG